MTWLSMEKNPRNLPRKQTNTNPLTIANLAEFQDIRST